MINIETFNGLMKIFSLTDKNGYLPEHNCRVCGSVLLKEERYLGIYTGLCYKCEKRKPFVEKECENGAYWISYPPHCPSWRRDRERFVAYWDCMECGGKGRIMIKRAFGLGGSYPKQCRACWNRYLEMDSNCF